MFSAAKAKAKARKIKAVTRTAATKTRRYAIIASVLLNCIAAGGFIGAPYLANTGLAHAAQLPGAGLRLNQVAYLSQSIPANQLTPPPEQVAYVAMPTPGHNPFYKTKAR